MQRENLETNATDALVASTKSVFGAVPIAGPFLSELVGCIIPNQRVDRLTNYVKQLEVRLSSIESSKLKNATSSPEGIDLIEEGFVQAARTMTDERRKYIANIIANGIDSEVIEYSESKYLLKLFQELNEEEVIWLRFYLKPTANEDKEFRDKHKNILEPIHAYIGSGDRTVERSSLQTSYIEHLERLGLTRSHHRINRETGIPEFDRFTGKIAISHRTLTPIGKLLLKQIGLCEVTNA
ncbi:hypothetical protein [Vibrio rotiferianus]|uniref:Uncharacterized protein n=1 Tax=Vibrio sp. DAT722 TaxID=344879 RepID=Q2F9U0_9VIBR|nr:hypothetical protein [Vibrio rotiferianus]ABA55931.1 hypothetical protein [Vibrio sp. DAT722]